MHFFALERIFTFRDKVCYWRVGEFSPKTNNNNMFALHIEMSSKKKNKQEGNGFEKCGKLFRCGGRQPWEEINFPFWLFICFVLLTGKAAKNSAASNFHARNCK
uniref:(northern house mosquito) hypothetical protein n=1 Tax=Culex pipiens TaxID=7175 RepID=A0A8D8CVN4_CULPI